jgi:hypothetical protein
MTITGGCLCGAVRFEIAAEAPLFVRQCWCRVCQYLGAGSGTVNAIFPRDAVTVSGPMTDFVNVADSGSVMHRRFCSQCGTAIFTEAEPRPNFIGVRVGALDDPNLATPAAIIWTGSAPAWACFDPNLPQAQGPAPPPTPKA